MLTGLWTIGIKVPDLDRELEFHRAIGNEIVLDEILTIDNIKYRIPLIKMGDKYLHLAETMVYESQLGIDLPIGPTHLVYISDDFEKDIRLFVQEGALAIREPVEASAGFGDRKVAFFGRRVGGFLKWQRYIDTEYPMSYEIFSYAKMIQEFSDANL